MAASRSSSWFPPRTRWTEGDARVALDAWKRSGLSAHRFAREHGVTAQRLYWWRERLAAGSVMSLVPGEIVEIGHDREPAHTQMVIRAGEARIEITGASATWVAQLVRELAT